MSSPMVRAARSVARRNSSDPKTPPPLPDMFEGEHRRGYRGVQSWLRYLPWIVVGAFLHWVVLSHDFFGEAPPEKASGADVAKIVREMLTLNPRTAQADPEPRDEPEPTPPEDPPVEARNEPIPPAVQEPEKQPENTPETVEEEEEPLPDASIRKEIEGEIGEEDLPEETTAPEPVVETPPEEPPKTEEPHESQNQTITAAELRREEWQQKLARPDQDAGHIGAAFQRWEAQAEKLRKSAARGAAGERDGLPHLEPQTKLSPDVFRSSLELFGGELVLKHPTEDKVWHFELDEDRCVARELSWNDAMRLAAKRGLNIGCAQPLDLNLTSLPGAVRQEVERVLAREGLRLAQEPGDTDILFAIRTTREQSAVAAAAQEFLRRHKERFPEYRFWTDTKVIEYRYLFDEKDMVYGIEIHDIR